MGKSFQAATIIAERYHCQQSGHVFLLAERHQTKYARKMAPKISPSDLVDKFVLRMPDGMRERIAIEAHRNKRSMNAEIIEVLDREFPAAPSLEEIFEQVDFLIDMYKKDADDLVRRDMLSMLSVIKIKFDELRKNRSDKPLDSSE
ncbi:Arc family DNA-binding protein [Mesorhizobium sp. L-2-11]|uniref:Arc family DNA-binding protein n=1 Tax=Mesorhizobium sp. L-2-11 TaxID=2744521 RepID=UPI00192554A6|nr:Arc family DNA-binding protein [Mesorhizobium sp. L-2-11]